MRAGLGLAAAAVAAGVVAPAAVAAAAPISDPPGNNGTIKIHKLTSDEGTENQPHVTCTFTVQFFGFDANEQGQLLFTAQPPTGNGQTLLHFGPVIVSNDSAGGGPNDPDAAFTFSLNDFNLDGISPQQNQGFHVKLTVSTTSGATKHKVFWVKPCPSPSPSKSKSASPSPSPSKSKSASPSPSRSKSKSASPSPSASKSATAPQSATPIPSGAVPAGGGGGPAGSLVWGLGALTAATGAGVILILARLRRENA